MTNYDTKVMNLLKSRLFILVCLAINHTQKNIAFPDNALDLREIKSKFHDIGKNPTVWVQWMEHLFPLQE